MRTALIAVFVCVVLTSCCSTSPTGDVTSENVRIAALFTDEIYSRGNMEIAAEIVDASHVFHVPNSNERLVGPAGVVSRAAKFRRAFADIEFVTHEVVAQGSLVSRRWTFKGTHQGDFLAWHPPAGALPWTA